MPLYIAYNQSMPFFPRHINFAGVEKLQREAFSEISSHLKSIGNIGREKIWGNAFRYNIFPSPSCPLDLGPIEKSPVGLRHTPERATRRCPLLAEGRWD